MKNFYLLMISMAVLLLIFTSAITFAIPQEYSVAITLEKYPETWELTVNKSTSTRLEELHVKNELLKFITQNKAQYMNQDVLVSSSLIALLFSVIGYGRERNIEKTQKRDSL